MFDGYCIVIEVTAALVSLTLAGLELICDEVGVGVWWGGVGVGCWCLLRGECCCCCCCEGRCKIGDGCRLGDMRCLFKGECC